MPRKRKVVTNQGNEEVPKVVSKAKKPSKDEKPAKKLKREPEWAIGEGLNVAKVILSIQKSDCNTRKCIVELQKLYKKMQHSTFMRSFIHILRVFLNRDEGDEYATRVLKFMAMYVASYGEETTESGASHPIIDTIFGELLSVTSNVLHVRLRLCILITNIITSFSQKAELDETIIEKITERMLYFLKDISPIMRAQAALAMQRLQDPENATEDPVTKAYSYHMESDPASKVRQAVITTIAKKPANIAIIIERLHDIDEKVRRHTYLQIASFSVKTYKISDRIAILEAGMHDRSEIVKKVVINMLLPNWIGVYDYDYAEFIRAIKLDSNEKELSKFRNRAEKALNEIFKKRKLSDILVYLNTSGNQEFKNCPSIEKSSLEMLIVWKTMLICHHDYVEGKCKNGITDNQEDINDDEIDSENDKTNESCSQLDVFPEMTIFCKYMENFVKEYKFGQELEAKYQKIYFSQCITVLLEISQLNDLYDEVGKAALQDFLKSLLLEYDLSQYPIEEIARIIEKIIPSVDQRLTFFNEIINEIVKPGTPSEYSRQTVIDELINKSDMDRKLKANNIKLRLMDLKEQETVLAERKQYAECQKVSEEYRKLNQELVELLRPVAEMHSIQSSQSVLENFSLANEKSIKPSEILKCLKICYFTINTKGVKIITHDILQIYNEFVRFHLESTDVTIRIWALKTATAYSLLYEPIAKEIYFILKSQVFKSAQVLIWECSIECIFDLLLRYSIETINNYDAVDPTMNMSSNQSRSRKGGRTLYTDVDTDDDDVPDDVSIVRNIDIMQILTHIIDQNVDKKIYRVTIHGLCKLILHGIYCTREIISKFLLMYFNPASEPEISQMMGIFFENIIKRKKQEYLHDALIPTIITLLEAPYDSPLKEVKLETVLKYVTAATRPIFCSNGLNLHNTLAMKFMEIMRENPDNKEILKTFSKELLELEIGEDPILKRDIKKQIDLILKDSLADQRTKKYLTDFLKILQGTYRAPLEFSSTAKTPIENAEDDDEQLDHIEEENEEENDEQHNNQENVLQKDEEENILKSYSSDFKFDEVSISNIKLIDFQINISKVAIDNVNVSNIDETLTEDIQIPASQEHCEIPSTQEQDIEIPATQDIKTASIDESSISDNEVTPETPNTVVKKNFKRNNPKVAETTIISDDEEIPAATPIATSRKDLKAKRYLNISHSTPTTPSMSSPLRKNARNSLTLKSPPITPLANLRSISKTGQSPVVTSNISSPNTEGRMTRNQSRIEMAQNTTVTRSASKILKNVKPTETFEKQPIGKDYEKKQAVKKIDKPSKLPVKKTTAAKSNSTQEIRPTRRLRTTTSTSNSQTSSNTTINPPRPPWK